MTETESIDQVSDVTNINSSSEPQLTNEVAELWLIHNKAKTSLHQTRAELKRIRTDLSQRLSELKRVLSRPGRGGAWSSFLASQTIPRSSADRLVRAHEKTISADRDSCASEQILETNEVVVQRYVRAIWPKLSRVLTTRASVQLFTVELLRVSERSFADHSLLDPSQPKIPEGPSYLRHLNLPVSAALNNVGHA
jgi:hypothetical protein